MSSTPTPSSDALPIPEGRKPLDPQDLSDMPVRAEHVIWLPGALADIEDLPEVFEEEFCENLPEKADSSLYQQLPMLARFAQGERIPSALDVAEALALNSVGGFLVQAETPIKKYLSETEICQYGWGAYRVEWLYAATEADIGLVMLAWASKLDAKWRAEFAEKAEAAIRAAQTGER